MSILIIEDDIKLAMTLKRALQSERYSVDMAHDGESGFEKALKNNHSLILLDLMLPKKDGISICRELRANNIHVPIIMITAKSNIEDIVYGLDMGADDYLPKPFNILELLARVRATLRRPQRMEPDLIKFHDLILDKNKHQVTKSGEVLYLTPKEYKILYVLLNNQGETISRQKLIEHAWGPEFREKNNELNVHIRYLRKKIDDNNSKSFLQTVRGFGFILKE